mgnify:CR=1 FL=1|jgi:hypothetical protein
MPKKTGSLITQKTDWSDFLDKVAASSFAKHMPSNAYMEGTPDPWNDLWKNFGQKKALATKEIHSQMGQYIDKQGGIDSFVAKMEKLPPSIMNTVSSWAEDMSDQYEEYAEIATTLRNDTSSDGYKEAITGMNSINAAFLRLDKDLIHFQTYREEGAKTWENTNGMVTQENLSIQYAFLHPDAMGKNGILDDAFAIGSDGQMLFKINDGDGNYSSQHYISDLKVLKQNVQNQDGTGFHNGLLSYAQQGKDYNKGVHDKHDNDGRGWNDGKWRYMDKDFTTIIQESFDAMQNDDMLDIFYNSSYAGVVHVSDGSGGYVADRTDKYSTVEIKKYKDRHGNVFDNLDDCGGNVEGCIEVTEYKKGDKTKRWGGNEKLVVDKYLVTLHNDGFIDSRKFDDYASSVIGVNRDFCTEGDNSSDSRCELFNELYSASNEDRAAWMREQMKSGHYVDENGYYTSEIRNSGMTAFYKKDYAEFLWHERQMNAGSFDNSGTGTTSTTFDAMKWLNNQLNNN